MANVDSIGIQKTPGRPSQITFAPNTGLPASIQPLVLIGHRGSGAASGASGIANYSAVTISNVSLATAASGEAIADFGAGSELAAMIVAAVTAVQNGSVFPPIVAIPLAYGDTDWGNGTNQAMITLNKITAGVAVSCYDGDGNSTNIQNLIAQAVLMSGPTRTDNNQFGTTALAANLSQQTPASLHKYDTQNFMGVTLRDSGSLGANPYSVAQLAAAAGALLLANDVPFNPMDNTVAPGVTAPANQADWYSIGAGLDSETVLNQGWTPMRVLATGAVAFVRTVTSRLTSNGVTPVTAYYDFQDFQTLYYFRESVWVRETQPDFTNTKASVAKAKALKSEILRIAGEFQDDGMFQNVDQLASQFVVQSNAQDRSRFDCLWPVNVIAGLHTIANNIQAGTQFDTFVV